MDLHACMCCLAMYPSNCLHSLNRKLMPDFFIFGHRFRLVYPLASLPDVSNDDSHGGSGSAGPCAKRRDMYLFPIHGVHRPATITRWTGWAARHQIVKKFGMDTWPISIASNDVRFQVTLILGRLWLELMYVGRQSHQQHSEAGLQGYWWEILATASVHEAVITC